MTFEPKPIQIQSLGGGRYVLTAGGTQFATMVIDPDQPESVGYFRMVREIGAMFAVLDKIGDAALTGPESLAVLDLANAVALLKRIREGP